MKKRLWIRTRLQALTDTGTEDSYGTDAEALLSIYVPYVATTAVTFEYEIPSMEEFSARGRRVQKNPGIEPIFVIEKKE